MTPPRLRDLARCLELLRRDLETLVAPELQSAAAQSAAAMMLRLLEMLTQELSADSDPPSPATAPILESLPAGVEAASDAALWRACDALAARQELCDSGRGDVAWDASYQESGAGSRAASAGRSVERALSADMLRAYVNEMLPGCAGANVARLERLPGGYSKGTFVADLRFADGREESWVLRRDLSFTPLETCVTDEYPLLVALHARGLPVAEPLWCEADPARLGAPVIALRKVAGGGDMAQWGRDPAMARAVALAAARTLAAIHATDTATLPALQTEAPGCSGAVPAAVIDHVEAFWLRYRIEPSPLVELLFRWLRLHAPAPGARGLVHGDYGLHNLLVADGRIGAVLDWEFAHLGDPREDLAYARPFVEKVLPWAEFAGAYEAAGGAAGDDAALRFYTVLGTLRNALGCMKVLHALRHGIEGIDVKFVYVGRSYAQQLLRSAAKLTGQF